MVFGWSDVAVHVCHCRLFALCSRAYDLLSQDALDQVKAENAEKALLGTGKPYQRTIP